VQSRDIDWFVPLCLVTGLELLLSGSFDFGGIFPAYLLLTVAGALVFAFSIALRTVFTFYRQGEQRPTARLAETAWDSRSRMAFILATLIIATLSGCAITAMKYGIPQLVPFYADPALAKLDRMIFGQDAWRWTHAMFGWAFAPINVLYGTWAFGQVATFTAVLFSAPSNFKTQALIAHMLMWLLLGVVLAYAFSSVGPIFYEQVYGGTQFSGFAEVFDHDPSTVGPAHYLWKAYENGALVPAAGISAMPSLHVAGATWAALVFGTAFPRLSRLGWVYVALIYLGSMMTGWHYATDGIVGVSGVLLVWKLAGKLADWRQQWSAMPAESVEIS
jgi:hypothetical protein